MVRSIRVRLTVWNGAVLAVFLLSFAWAAYAFLRHATLSQTDRGLRQQVEMLGMAVRARDDFARTAPDPAIVAVLHDLRARGLHVTMVSPLGAVMTTAPISAEGGDERDELGDASATMDSTALARAMTLRTERPSAFTVGGPEGGLRAVAAPLRFGPKRYTVVITQSLSEVDELLGQARGAALISVPIVLLLAIAGGYGLARRGLAPVAAMNDQAQRIDARNLHQRLAVADAEDELGQLAGTFNALLERVERAFEQQRRFTADASHELRTPVAIVRGEADVALASEGRTVEQYRDALRVVRDGSERLSRIVNDLFLLARADAGQVSMKGAPLYLDEVLTDVARSMRSLAQQRGIDIRVSVPDEVPYLGDEELLRRLLVNLLDNAIKYSARAGVVRLTLDVVDGGLRVSVTDSGVGIPAAARPHVFERFYRGDVARALAGSANGSGAGLGLSIAQWVAELHRGTLEIVASSPDGTTFELFLPVSGVVVEQLPAEQSPLVG